MSEPAIIKHTQITKSETAYQYGESHNNCSGSTDHYSGSSESDRAECVGDQAHGMSTSSSGTSKHGNADENIIQRRWHLDVPPKRVENHPDLQGNDNEDQGHRTIDEANLVNMSRVLRDPPERAPGGSIELKEEGDEEEQDEVTERGSGRESEGVMGGKVEDEREEEQVEGVDTALERAEDEGVPRELAAVESVAVGGLEGGEARDGVQPVEEAVEG